MLKKLIKKGADIRVAVKEIQDQIIAGAIGGKLMVPIFCKWDDVDAVFTTKFLRLSNYDCDTPLVPGDVMSQAAEYADNVMPGPSDWQAIGSIPGKVLAKNLKSTVVSVAPNEDGINVDITFSVLPHPDFAPTNGVNGRGWYLITPFYQDGVKNGHNDNQTILAVDAGSKVVTIAPNNSINDCVLAIQDDLSISGYVLDQALMLNNPIVFHGMTSNPRSIAAA